MKLQSYKVYAEEPRPIGRISMPGVNSVDNLHPGILFLIWIASVAVIVVCCAFYDAQAISDRKVQTSDHGAWIIVGIIGATIITLVSNFVSKVVRIPYLHAQWTAEAKQVEIDKVENEAKRLTESFQSYYKEANELLLDTEFELEEATEWIERAEKEYQEGAFDPFWEAIEKVTISLNYFGHVIRKIDREASAYCEGISKVKHNFPTYPIKAKNIPNPTVIIERWRIAVRKGQKDFKFAQIWRQRELRRERVSTKDSSLTGFISFSEAFNLLGERTEDSRFDLEEKLIKVCRN